MTKTLSRFAFLPLLLLALGAGPCSAQTPVPLPIAGNLGTLAGTPMPDAYITVLLENCTGGQPQITGYTNLVATSYQFVADSNGAINATVWANDQITCNGTIGATLYALSLYDPNNTQIGQTQCFAVLHTQGVWNINTQTPVACGTTPPNPTNGTYGNLNSTGFFGGNNGSFNTLTVGGVPIGPGGGNYLPLAGGTLTGGLNGTTGAFAGNLTAPALNNASVNLWQNPLAFGVASGQSSTTVTATGASTSLTLSSAGDFVARQGVLILHAGSACGTVKASPCPSGPTPTVTPQGTPGTTTYTYNLSCLDGLGGVSIAGTAGTTTTGASSLAGVVSGTSPLTGNYNQVTWTGVAGCYQVAIYRNNLLIAQQWSGASGTQTFNDVGLSAWTSRDIPSAPPASALADNYDGFISTISGTAATVSPALGSSVTTATMYHDDSPLMQAAINASPFVDIPPGNYTFRYPINYTKHSSSFTSAGEIKGDANIGCDTGDICIDATGSQNVTFEDINLQAGSSAIQLYLSRDTSNGDLAQSITTQHVGFVAGIESSNVFSPQLGGRGKVGLYNHAAEIQHNVNDQFQADRWMVLTSNNIDHVSSTFSATDDTGTASMSQVDCYSCFGGGYVFAELDSVFTVNFDNGYGLGGFLDLRHPWGFEVDTPFVSARLKINGFRVEGKNGLITVAPGGMLQEPFIWSDLYRVQAPPYALATTAQIWLNAGASLSNAPMIQIDDYGGSGGSISALVDGPGGNCGISNTKLIIGIWESVGTCGLSGQNNTITGFGQGDYSLPPAIGLNGSASATWIKLGTWVTSNPAQGDTLGLTLFSGSGFTAGTDFPNRSDIIVRAGNGGGSLPNLSGAKLFNLGAATYDNIKVVATAGSTSTTNSSWDIYIHQVSAFAGGTYRVDKFGPDQWTNNGASVSDPGAGSSTILVGDVTTVATTNNLVSSITDTATATGAITFTGSGVSQAGNTFTFSTGGVTSINSTAGAFTFTGAGVSCTGTTCTFSGAGTGVSSIDTQTGAFTFAGAGVSHVGNAYTFSGTGSGVSSVAMTVPTWLTVAGSPITTSGSLDVTATGGQTVHRVIGTCGAATSFAPCALVAGDLPSLPESQITNLTTDLAAKVANTTTVNGHALSSNVVVSASDITTGTLPTAQLPSIITATQFQTNAEFSNGTCTTAKTIDPANGNRQKVTLTNGSTCALTFTQPGAGTATVQLKIIQSTVSAFNGGISGCKWPGGVVPTITQTTGAVDMLSAYLDGTNAYCQIAQSFQ